LAENALTFDLRGLVLLLESRVVSDYWHNLVLRFLRKRIEERDEKEGEDIRKEREAVKVIVQNGNMTFDLFSQGSLILTLVFF